MIDCAHLPPGASPKATYWPEACEYLMGRDRVMKKLIEEHAGVSLQSRGDAFVTLARSIVGQQISTQAAQSVWERFARLLPQVKPAQVLSLEAHDLRAAGLSGRKVQYLMDLAAYFVSHPARAYEWADMPDEDVVQELVTLRGVGRWTAQMFLIFHLMRPNVLPLDDVGLQKGISRCYFSDEPVSRSEMREVGAIWAPFCSVATWYIWRSLSPVPPAY